MPFDANLCLRDARINLTPATAVAPTSTSFSLTTGFKVLDLGGTTRRIGDNEGAQRISVVMFLPTAPTTYGDTLTMWIEQSDDVDHGFEFVADFPEVFTYTRLLDVTISTAFVAADVGGVLTGAATGSVGVLEWMHSDAKIVGRRCHMIIAMANPTDTYASTEQVSGGSAGVGNTHGASVISGKPYLDGPNTYITTFGATKRYLRLDPSVSDGGNFGKVNVFVTTHYFRNT